MASVRYSSRDVVLEPQTYTLRVGDEVHRPEPKVFELLSYLMRNPGRVVPKEELLDALWSNEVVGESVLTRCVSCARKLIQDDSRSPKFVRTAHGRGYEFVAPVSAETIRSPGSSVPPDADLAGVLAETGTPSAVRPFVGRKEEARILTEAIRNVRSEHHRLILVSGEAGIGKTRLVEEVTSLAESAAEVHWSRASETEGAPPLFMWQRCLRSIAKERSMKVALRALRDATGGTRQLLLGTDRFSAAEVVGWDSPSTRFRTFDAILCALSELARQREFVLVLDDLHNADLTSLLLLKFVVEQGRAAPFLIFGTLRDADPATDPTRRAVLTGLLSTPGPHLSLRGLDRAEVREFLGVHDTRDDERLHLRSGGNPLFLSMLAIDSGSTDSSAPLSSALRQAVLDRLRALPRRTVELLTLGAVFGADFEGAMLARAAGLSEAECVDGLRVAGDARIALRGPKDRWAFVHDLVREVLYDELSAGERAKAHHKVGSILETYPEYREARHAATLARHMILAGNHAGAARTLDLSIRAGAHALRSFAFEEAIEHFSRSRELLATSAELDPATECAVLLDLGLSQVSAGEREAARSTLQAAAEKAREVGASEELAHVALNLAPGLFTIETGVYDPALVEILREALEQVGERNRRLRALLLGRLALALYWSDTFEERARLCEEAARIAEQLGAPDVLASVTTARAFALIRPSNLDERWELARTAMELSRRVGDHQLLMLNGLLLGTAELERGDLAAFVFQAQSFRVLAEQTRQPQALWIVEAHRASRLLLDGRLDEVEALSGACLGIGQRVHDHNALLTFGVHLTLVRIEQGRAEEMLDAIRDYAARYPLIVGWRVLYAYALSRAGKTNGAESEYRSFKAREFSLPEDLNWMVSMAWLSELCHALGDGAGAEILYERLLPYRGRLVTVGYAGIACLGSVERHLGLLASTLGRLDEARRHFETAVRVNRETSATLPLAHTLRDFGVLLAKLGAPEAARTHLEEAQSLASSRKLAALAAIIRSS